MEALQNMKDQLGTVKWQGPEKVAGGIALAAVGGLLFYFWGTILPFLIAAVQNTLLLIGLGLTLAAVIWFFSQKQTRVAISYLMQMILRKFIGFAYTIKPIETMEIACSEAREDQEEINKSVEKLEGTFVKVSDQIRKNNGVIEAKMEEAGKAKSMAEQEHAKGDKADRIRIVRLMKSAEIANHEAVGHKKINEKLLPLQGKLKQLVEFMKRMYEAADLQITKTEKDVEMMKLEYESVNSGYSGLKSAMALFNGTTDNQFAFDLAATHIQDDMSRKLGEMKRAMELSVSVLDSVDIQRGVASEKGWAMLEEFQNGELVLLNEYDKNDILGSANSYLPLDAQYTITRPLHQGASSPHDKLLN